MNNSIKPLKLKYRCFYFSKSVVHFVNNSKFNRIFFSIFDQLVRSATSIGANIIESGAGSSRRDWRNFYFIALKSANETKYWLCLVKEINLQHDEINKLITEANELSKIIASIILKAKCDLK